jgi:hypothetical protein
MLIMVVWGRRDPPGRHCRQPGALNLGNRRLDVGDLVVEPEDRILQAESAARFDSI